MSNLPAIEVAKRATHDTRNRVLLSKTKMTSIADASNRNRMTIAKWLDGDDMSLARIRGRTTTIGRRPGQDLGRRARRQGGGVMSVEEYGRHFSGYREPENAEPSRGFTRRLIFWALVFAVCVGAG